MNTRGRESGFTLMELMVAMGLTVAALGIGVVAINGLSSMRETSELLTDGNQTLRASLNLITRDLVATGRLIPVGGISVPTGAGSTPILRPAPPDPPGPPLPALVFPPAMIKIPAVIPGDGLGPPAVAVVGNPPTDMVTLLMVDEAIVCPGSLFPTALADFDLAAIAANGTAATVDARTTIVCPGTGIKAGDLIMILASTGSSLQMVTGATGQAIAFAATDPMQLNQPAAAGGNLAALRLPATGNYPAARAYRVNMITYYIEATPDPSRPLDPPRSRLMRRVNFDPASALGIGIENLQITYDVEPPPVNGVQPPLSVNLATPGNPNLVRKLTVFVSGRSRRPSTQTRQFLRTSMSTQVSLRSLSLRDRYTQ